MSLNLVYICIFLINTRRDCIVTNIIVWSLFIRDVFTDPGKYGFPKFTHITQPLLLSILKKLISFLIIYIKIIIIGLTSKTHFSSLLLSSFSIKFTLDA